MKRRFIPKLNKLQLIGLAISLLILLIDLILLWGKDIFYFLLGIAVFIGGLPFFISLIIESRVILEKDEMFLEFARNLVESVKAGTPISKSILNIKNKDYGVLNPYIAKLSNQISLGIPIKTSLDTFARDVKSSTISRAVIIISESEKAGGQIEEILESVVKSVSQAEILKKERKAAIYTLVVQGYIIFLVFIIIMLVMQFKILPIATSLGDVSKGTSEYSLESSFAGILGGGGPAASPEELAAPFLWLLLVQGFFTGIVIGKLSEGSLKSGLKHSFVLVMLSLLINTGANFFLG